MMRAAWLIARKDLRLLARDKMALFWVFLFPIGFALFFGSIMKAGVDAEVAPLNVVLVSESGEPIGEAIESTLRDAGMQVRHASLSEASRAVQLGQAAAYLHIPQDPLEAIKLGVDPTRRAQSAMLQGLVRSALMPKSTGFPAIETLAVETRASGPHNGFEIVLPSMLIWGLIGCVATFAIALVSERTAGTLLRLRAAPISRIGILLGKSLACAGTCAVDLLMLSLVGHFGFGVPVDDPLKYVVALLACTACFTGLTVALSVVGKTEQSVSGAGWSTLIVLAMIGGAMVPPSVMPEWLLRLSHFSPVKWGIWTLEGATWRALGWSDLLPELALLCGFGALAFGGGVVAMLVSREL